MDGAGEVVKAIGVTFIFIDVGSHSVNLQPCSFKCFHLESVIL